MLFLDSETFLFKPGLLAPPPVVFSFQYDGGAPFLELPEAAAHRIERAMASREPLCGHNIAYDLAVLCAFRPSVIPAVFKHYRDGLVADTKTREELIDIEQGRSSKSGRPTVLQPDGSWRVTDYSLAGLAMRYLGKDRTIEKEAVDAWRKRYAELATVPLREWPREARKYALDDVADTAAVYQRQPCTSPDESRQARAAWALHLMACWGIRTETEAVERLEAELSRKKIEASARLREAGFYRLRTATVDEREAGDIDAWEEKRFKNGKIKRTAKKYAKDTKYIQKLVEDAFGGTPPRTDTGLVSTEKDVCIRSGNELLKLYAACGGYDKILQTYCPVLRSGVFVPINPRWRVLVNSGRTSCAEPNLQNLPRGRPLEDTDEDEEGLGWVRDCFVPRPGYHFISVDYSTLELRALAQVCLQLFGMSRMAEVLREGKDLHLAMAAEMLHISYAEAEARLKTDKRVKRARSCAKVANFGLPGGLGAQALVDYARKGYGVILTLAEAQELKSSWLQQWPEMTLYFQYISKKVGHGKAQFEQLFSGRKRGWVGYTDGCNTLFQGLAADGGKEALFDVSHECYVDLGTALFGCRVVVYVHDEIIIEAPISRASAAADRLVEVMCLAMARWIRDVPIAAAPAMMTRWIKDAEEARNEQGELIPWERHAA